MKALRKTMAVTCLALVAAGCGAPKSQYVLLRSRLVESTRDDLPEITPTPAFQSAISSIKQVAVRAPDVCASETASAATGAASNRGTLVTTRCGVEMAELERALTRAGYVVFSWKQINSMVSNTMTPEAAAKQLGAQVLFQVNSLERVDARPGRDARWERSFHKSDKAGVVGELTALKESEITQLRAQLNEREALFLKNGRLGVMLDVNAVLISSGQTIWFYRWIRTEQDARERAVTLLARRGKGGAWGAVAPERANAKEVATTTARDREIEAVSVSGRSTSELDAAYFQLMREVVADFAQRFSRNSNGTPASQPLPPGVPPPPPPPPPMPKP
ncbi:MAG: hypothetical protein U0228_13885 [Myxococcaceae bacterium]